MRLRWVLAGAALAALAGCGSTTPPAAPAAAAAPVLRWTCALTAGSVPGGAPGVSVTASNPGSAAVSMTGYTVAYYGPGGETGSFQAPEPETVTAGQSLTIAGTYGSLEAGDIPAETTSCQIATWDAQ